MRRLTAGGPSGPFVVQRLTPAIAPDETNAVSNSTMKRLQCPLFMTASLVGYLVVWFSPQSLRPAWRFVYARGPRSAGEAERSSEEDAEILGTFWKVLFANGFGPIHNEHLPGR